MRRRTASFDSSFDEASYDDLNPTSDVTPDHLAYMIYTSGSTGKPKGALIMHRGLVNYLTWCLHAYPLDEGQGAPVHSSISFDLTVTSLFAPLVSGRQREPSAGGPGGGGAGRGAAPATAL